MPDLAIAVEGAARGRDETSFEALLEPLLEPGYRLACALLHDPQSAEDCVQEAALKAWQKLDRLREGSEMRPWFLGIVANECRSTRRSRWWSVLKAVQPDPRSNAVEDHVLSGLEVRRALRSLSHDKRLVLVLRWYLDLPLREIALLSGVSEHAAESRLQRAVAELRGRLEKSDG